MSIRNKLKEKAPWIIPAFDILKESYSAIEIPFLISLNKKGRVIGICPNGIGEITFNWVFARSFMNRIGVSKIYFLIGDNRKECGVALGDEDIHYYYVPFKKYRRICAFCLSKAGQKLINRLNNIYFFDSWDKQNNKGNNFFETERRLMSLLPDEFPNYRLSYISNNKAQVKKRILINPYARTVNSINLAIYEDIVHKLNSAGLDCYTFVHSGQSPINGSKELNVTLKESLIIANQSFGVIGTRSGFMDLMSILDTKIICLYPDDSTYNKYFSFQNCPWNRKIVEIFCNKITNVDEVCNHFLSTMNNQ